MTVCAEPEAQTQAQGRRQAGAGVQPSGFLVGLSSDWRIICASANLEQFTGIDADEALGSPISSCFTADAVHLIRNRAALLRDEESPERLLDQKLTDRRDRFDGALRLSGDAFVLEAVPAIDSGGIDVAGAIQRMLRKVESCTSLEDLGTTATRELRGLTGFDAIHIYRNGPSGTDCVASSVRSGLSEFEPANVQPAALQKPLWIADGNSDAVSIRCLDEERLKIAPALIASPEPALLNEIRRTGARSAILLPIAGEEEPWGFALALHRNARRPRLARLSVAELFTHVLGLRIQAVEVASEAR